MRRLLSKKVDTPLQMVALSDVDGFDVWMHKNNALAIITDTCIQSYRYRQTRFWYCNPLDSTTIEKPLLIQST